MSGRQGAGGEESLRSSVLKSRIAKLPHLPAIAPSQHSSQVPDGQEEEQRGDRLGSLTMAPPPRSASQRGAESKMLDRHYSPLSAADCFHQALEVEVGRENGVGGQVRPARGDSGEPESTKDDGSRRNATFRVYYTPPVPQHQGKQQQSSSSSRFDPAATDGMPSLDSLQPPVTGDDEGEDDDAGQASSSHPGTIFLFHHGAGYSGLSYALVAKHITEMSAGRAGVLAFDCRGHGKTRHSSPKESEQLSIENLTDDCLSMLAKLFPPSQAQPTLILVGHSMGGSVVVSVCHALSNAAKTSNVPRVAGVAVLDVVEGTAMSALSSMKTVVSALPPGFDSVEEAIRWHVDSGTIVNAHSARRSVPSLLLKSDGNGESLKEEEGDEGETEAVEELSTQSPSPSPVEGEGSGAKRYAYTWRANLLATEPYWVGWFQGLSQSFLSVKCARLLLLAGTDRLDKDLMIGQMQGKYQLVVFADVGHSLQEDAPQRTAQTLLDFWRRNEGVNVSNIRGLRKVGQS